MYQRFVKIVLIALSLLFIPFVAMQFTDNVQWTYGDFIIMGCMLTVYMLTINSAPNSLYGVKKIIVNINIGFTIFTALG